MKLQNKHSWIRFALLALAVSSVGCIATAGQNRAATSQKATKVTVPSAGNTAAPITAPTAPSDAVDPSFIIGPSDVLNVSVWKEPEISRTVPVRLDGKITLPLAGDIMASGLTTDQLQLSIREKLEPYLTDPEVTVIVQEAKSKKVNIFGRVSKPGSYELTKPTTVLDGIAMAGGLGDFAKASKIYVLRTDANGQSQRYKFNYKDVLKGKNSAQNIQLLPHDTIVVP
jgi:polysaccharide export outer membrane protein